MRYLKHVKGRNTELSEKIYLLNLSKGDEGLHYKFLGMDEEKSHLFRSFESKEDREEEMDILINSGLSDMDIANKLGVDRVTVWRRRKKLNS